LEWSQFVMSTMRVSNSHMRCPGALTGARSDPCLW
jgi:hypothetical protein